MLLMQELRSWLEKERLSLDPGNQAGGSLMTLKNVVVVGKSIDIRQAGALSQKIANSDSVCPFNPGDQIAYVVIQSD